MAASPDAAVHRGGFERLTPQQRWAVTATWRAVSPASSETLCDAWDAAGGHRNWHAAAAAAAVAGAAGGDASALADSAAASLSANQVREVWVDAVSEAVSGLRGGAGRIAHSWLVDAALTVDAVLGTRIAAEAAAAALAAMTVHQRTVAARGLVLSLHAAIRPDPLLVLRAVRQAGAFVHRGRCYLLDPAAAAVCDRFTGDTAHRRTGGAWAPAGGG